MNEDNQTKVTFKQEDDVHGVPVGPVVIWVAGQRFTSDWMAQGEVRLRVVDGGR